MSEKEFVAGLYAKAPHERAPDFVKASLSIKRADLGNWLRSKSDEWINLDLKEARGGKWYFEVNTFVPKKPQASNDASHTPKKTELTGYEVYDDVPF